MELKDTTVTVTGFSGCVLTIELEAFAPMGTSSKSRYRPSKITVPKLVDHLVAGKATPPFAISGMQGMTCDADLGNYDKGHIIANELGGPDSPYNIVPMLWFFNRNGGWRSLELFLGQSLHLGPCSMAVTITYGADPRIPSSFLVQVAQNAKFLVNETISHVNPVFKKIEVPEELAQIFKIGNEVFNDQTWGRDQDLLKYPTVGPRPYAVLDYLVQEKLVKQWPAFQYLDTLFPESNAASHGMDAFGDQHRALVKLYNAWLNDGVLKSDAYNNPEAKIWGPADPFELLREYSDYDKPEVDHIIPAANGGWNYYRNARLVSWFLNNKLARLKDYSGLVANATPKAPYSMRSHGKA